MQDGTLKVGDVVVCGSAYGRVKALIDDKRKELRQALPATPVEIVGLSEVPEPGDKFYVLDDAARAKDIAEDAKRRHRDKELSQRQQMIAAHNEGRFSAK